jgi:hypothetical protein
MWRCLRTINLNFDPNTTRHSKRGRIYPPNTVRWAATDGILSTAPIEFFKNYNEKNCGASPFCEPSAAKAGCAAHAAISANTRPIITTTGPAWSAAASPGPAGRRPLPATTVSSGRVALRTATAGVAAASPPSSQPRRIPPACAPALYTMVVAPGAARLCQLRSSGGRGNGAHVSLYYAASIPSESALNTTQEGGTTINP